MNTALPEPLSLLWPFKPMSSATFGIDTLPDGRKKLWIKHDILKNVTPHMLAWWFGNMEGDMEIEGQCLPRYRAWHPLDHVYLRYVNRAPDGSVGPGTQIALCEYLGRNPGHVIETVSTIEKIDATGFIHCVITGGAVLARMEHVFTKTDDGTQDENCLIVPGSPELAHLAEKVLAHMLPREKGEAWIRHNIEEVGMLENFLPELYERETKRMAVGTTRMP